MKDILLLMKERKAFYFVLLFATITITLCGSLNIVSTYTNHELLSGTPTEEQITAAMERQPILFSDGVAGGNLLKSYLENYSVLCHNVAFLMVVAVLVLLFYGTQQQQSREFMETLPIKKSTLELSNYVAAVSLLCINFFVGGMVGLITLSQKNACLLALKEQFPELLSSVIPSNLIIQGNLNFLWQLALAFLYLLVPMTFLYLCSCIFKNRYVGIIMGCLIHVSLKSFLDCFYILFLNKNNVPKETLHFFYALFDTKKVSQYYFNHSYGSLHPLLSQSIIALVLLLLFMVSALIIHSCKRELSKGRLMFSNPLQLLFLFSMGILYFIILAEWFNYLISFVIITIFETVSVYLLYHKKDKALQLAVTQNKVSKIPIIKAALSSHLIAGGVLALIMSGLLIDHYNMIKHHFLDFWHFYSTIEDNPLLDSLKNEYFLSTDFNVILIGIFLFKGIKFFAEQQKSTREFFETLPFTRLQVYCTKILMDLGVVTMPLLAYTIINTYYRIIFNQMLSAPLLYRWEEVIPTILTTLYSAIFIIGLLNLVDTFAVTGGFKVFHSIVTISFIFVTTIASVESLPRELYWYIYDLLYSGFPISCTALFMGILFIIIAGYFYCKRKTEKQIFFYGFAKHLFALQLTVIYAAFTLASTISDQNPVSVILSIVGCILTYVITLYFCSPNFVARLKSKYSDKK